MSDRPATSSEVKSVMELMQALGRIEEKLAAKDAEIEHYKAVTGGQVTIIDEQADEIARLRGIINAGDAAAYEESMAERERILETIAASDKKIEELETRVESLRQRIEHDDNGKPCRCRECLLDLLVRSGGVLHEYKRTLCSVGSRDKAVQVDKILAEVKEAYCV